MTNELENLKQKYKELGETIERMEKPELNLPQRGRYLIDIFGCADSLSVISPPIINNYNSFTYEHDAKVAALYNKIQRALIQAKRELCSDFVADFNNVDQYKFYPLYNNLVNCMKVAACWKNSDITAIYFDTKENATKAGEHVLPLYLELQELMKE